MNDVSVDNDLNYEYYLVCSGEKLSSKDVVAIPFDRDAEGNSLVIAYGLHSIWESTEQTDDGRTVATWTISDKKTFSTIEELEEYRDEKVITGLGEYKSHRPKKIYYLDKHGQVEKEMVGNVLATEPNFFWKNGK